MFQLHPSTRLLPPQATDAVEVDNEMVPLIQALWSQGWHTMACCQDNGEAVDAERAHGQRGEPTGHQGFIEYHRGLAWLKMPTTDTLCLLAELHDHQVFGPRAKVRWGRGSWRMHIPVIYQDGGFTPAPYTQIYFPKEQIAELAAALASGDGRAPAGHA
jgi:hypothetical protein